MSGFAALKEQIFPPYRQIFATSQKMQENVYPTHQHWTPPTILR
jgi:hypothetical protein